MNSGRCCEEQDQTLHSLFPGLQNKQNTFMRICAFVDNKYWYLKYYDCRK